MVFFIKKVFFSLLFLSIFSLSANAQVKISARLDSNQIVVGGVTHLNVTIQAPEGTEINTPHLRDSSKIELIDEVKTVKIPHHNGLLITQVWTLTALDSGMWTLPPMPFGYKLTTGETDTVYSPELSFAAIPAKLDSLTLRPISPIIDEPLSWRDALPYFIAAIILTLLLYVVYWYYNRKKMREVATQIAPELTVSPHIIAFEKLNILQNKQLWQQGNTKDYYIELTYIIREYLEKRYSLPILEQTTEEFLPILKKETDIPVDIFKILVLQLKNADIIKFAKGEASAEQNTEAMQFALLLVEKTLKNEIVQTEIDESSI